jgi:hypothetical protein
VCASVQVLISSLSQVRRIKAMHNAKKALASARSSRAASPTLSTPPEPVGVPFHRRLVDAILGAKGSQNGPGGQKPVNPVTRLKLLLVSRSAFHVGLQVLDHVSPSRSWFPSLPCMP